MKRYGCAIFLMGLLSCTSLAQAAASPTQEYILKNGLKLVVREDHRAPVVFSAVWYRVGSSYEHNGDTGLSHMLEHMMFRGTKRFGPGVLNQMVNDNGGIQNAMTGYDVTAYYQYWSADKLPLSFELESDRMRHLMLRKDLYQKEHQVVMEERRLRTDDVPQSTLFERFMAAALVNSPYRHSPVGWMTDLVHMQLADLRRWYEQWYAPNNATVIVVGDVKADQVYALAKKYFESLKPEKILPSKPRVEVQSLGKKTVVVHAENARMPFLLMGYPVPSLVTAKNKNDVYALIVLQAALGGGSSSRLVKDLIRGKQIAVSVSGEYDPYSLYSTLFIFSGVPATNHSLDDLEKSISMEIRAVQGHGISAAELARVKTQVIAQSVYKRDSVMAQNMEIGAAEVVGLSWRDIDAFVDRIKAVKASDVQAVAKRYLKENSLTVGKLLQSDKSLSKTSRGKRS